MSAARIIQSALAARTVADAQRVQDLIATDIGASYERPVGDRWNNHGLMSTPGNREYKLLELVTNAQDAVLERFALPRFGSYDAVPYETPHEAAADLLGRYAWPVVAEMVRVEFFQSDPPTRKTKRITPIVKDQGCGIAVDYLSKSLLHLGTAHKAKARWQQGAFGLGGASSFRHAQSVIIVTRPHPDLNPRKDRITVAVCQWQEHEKGRGLFYLTRADWNSGEGLDVEPWSAPSSKFPEFTGGTQISLISYEIDSYAYLTHGAERSFERILNTRLYDPVTPVRFANHLPKNEAERGFRGLKRQFEENPRRDRRVIGETMPFRINGETAHLPVASHYFQAGKREAAGAKRNFVAHDHAVLFTSNGQVHKHWSPQELRTRTELRHIYERVLVVVDLNELPIKLRTNLFPPDRSDLMDNEQARRLESDLIELLNDPEGELFELDRELLRQAITGESNGRPTINIARQIGRALKFKGGFALSGDGRGQGSKRKRKKRPEPDLYADPTTIEGPAHIEIEQGHTRGVRFHINARDEFLNSGRGTLELTCDHADIGEREVTVGQLRVGSVRVTIALAEGAELGDFTLTAVLRGWQRAAGGIGPDLEWQTKLTVIEPRAEEERKRRRGDEKPDADGELVGLAWRGEDDFDQWHSGVPGHVEDVEAKLLAEEAEDYRELEKLGDAKVPTIFLNRDYTPLKRYEAARARDLTPKGLEDARDRYAVGAGLGLLLLERDFKANTSDKAVPEMVELAAKQAAAQSTLVMMPQYDRLARATGVDE
jgi:hypothetical protein